MVQKTDMKKISYIETGLVDMAGLLANFDKLEADIKDHYNEIKALAGHQSGVVSDFIDQEAGIRTILNPSKHLRMKVLSAWAVMGDNIDDECIIELLDLSEPLRFSATEGAGKMRSFKLKKDVLHFIEAIRVRTSSNRRVEINIKWESIETGEG